MPAETSKFKEPQYFMWSFQKTLELDSVCDTVTICLLPHREAPSSRLFALQGS